MRFNPPPDWPVPESGQEPRPGWTPPASFPPVPPGWQLWVDDAVVVSPDTSSMDPASDAYVFVSHSRENRAIADQVTTELRRRGIRVFYAPTDIQSGENYQKVLYHALESCTHLLILVSRASLTSVHVSRELDLAEGNGKQIIPYDVEKLDFPDDYPPEMRYFFQQIQIKQLADPVRIAAEVDTTLKSGISGPASRGPRRKTSRLPIWAAVVAIIVVLGLTISLYKLYGDDTVPVDLEISSINLDGRQSAGAKVLRGTSSTDGTIDLTPIDITMQNKGDEPSLITRVDAEVVFFQQLKDCTGTKPAPGNAKAGYQIAIPMRDALPANRSIENEIRFEVKPAAADRMVLTVGPDVQPAFATVPMVMSVKLTFVHDDDQRMEIGTVSLVTTVAAANAQISGNPSAPGVQACAKENLTHLDKMFAIQATRSRLLDDLRSAYQSQAS
ncbi:MAG: toll/interleukin-1 receptor domain-containing protein [Gordonia sp. (in: high G+C Gram-positive bacteria)]|uniref:toll/interleukin-1 receptor domain-containing protein n=1 Tax=Gordonia sp. (in: high G+C Gram-positive bacteria) TaxID=84139 RepID=UPI0039E65F86